jgi:multiple sugar transport system substrate-binding protein
MKRILTLTLGVLLAAGLMAGCGSPANTASGKAYALADFAGSTGENMMAPVVDSKGNLVVASQPEGKPVQITTYDNSGSVVSDITTDVTGSALAFTLDGKDTVYILVASEDGADVHVLDTSGKTTNTIPVGDYLPQPSFGGPGGPQTQSNDSVGSGPQTQTGGPEGSEPETQMAGPENSGPQTNGEKASGKKLEAGGIAMGVGFAATSDGNVFLSVMGNGVIQVDSNGQQVRTYDAGTMDLICVNENEQLMVYSGGKEVALTTYNTQDGSQVSKTAVSVPVSAMFYDKQKKQLLYMNSDGISSLKPDGSAGDKVITLNDFYSDSTTRSFCGFAMDGASSIFIASSEGNSSKMMVQGSGGSSMSLSGGTANHIDMIALTDASSVQQKKVLTVAGLSSSAMVDAAITAFQKAHPDYKIELKTYNNQLAGVKQEGPGQEQAQDLMPLIQQFNTDIIAGNSADVYILDNLPYYKYIEDGLLADLGQMMADSDIDLSQYYGNIFDACKTEGKLYAIPASFSFDVLAGREENLPSSETPSISDFFDKANSLPEGLAAFPKEDATRAFANFMKSNYSYFVDQATQTARFDSAEFISLLNEFKSLFDTRMGEKSEQDMMPNEQIGTGDLAFTALEVDGFDSLAAAIALADGNLSYTGIPSMETGSYNFMASDLAGINASSQNKEMAWEFIKTLLSLEVQSTMQMEGFPVNKAACQSIADRMKSGDTKAMIATPTKQVEVKPLSDEQYADITETLSKLNRLSAPDHNIIKILNEELPTFFLGQKSAEDTASLIQNRVQTILNE